MAYIEPKTDWEPDDYLTPADYNRIKNNLVFLNDMFNEEYDYYEFEPGADIGIDEFYKASKWNMFEDCVENFQRTGVVFTFGERSYYKDNGHLPNYIQLNRLEKCIEAYATQDIPVTGISISPNTIVVEAGQSQTVNITLTPANATDKEVSISLPEGLSVSFNEDYSVATITAANDASGNRYNNLSFETHDGGFTAQILIYVKVPMTDFSVPSYTKLVDPTEYPYYIPITYIPSDARYARFGTVSHYDNLGGTNYYPSYDTEYSKIEITQYLTSGNIGNGWFELTIEGTTKRGYVYSDSDAITNIYASNGNFRHVGGTSQYVISWNGVKDADKNVVWSVDNTAVASINQSGLVTALAVGTATVRATWTISNKTYESSQIFTVT